MVLFMPCAPAPQESPFIPAQHEKALLDTDSHVGIVFYHALQL